MLPPCNSGAGIQDIARRQVECFMHKMMGQGVCRHDAGYRELEDPNSPEASPEGEVYIRRSRQNLWMIMLLSLMS